MVLSSVAATMKLSAARTPPAIWMCALIAPWPRSAPREARITYQTVTTAPATSISRPRIRTCSVIHALQAAFGLLPLGARLFFDLLSEEVIEGRSESRDGRQLPNLVPGRRNGGLQNIRREQEFEAHCEPPSQR